MNKIEIIKGDITKLEVDAIVNAANKNLICDGDVYNAAGYRLLDECSEIGGCAVGEAKITLGYRLPAKYIIHTVGPTWNGGHNKENEILSNCYKNSLKLSKSYKIYSIAFSAISTGVYGYPIEEATKIAINEVKEFLKTNHKLEKIYFVCFNDEVYYSYKNYINEI